MKRHRTGESLHLIPGTSPEPLITSARKSAAPARTSIYYPHGTQPKPSPLRAFPERHLEFLSIPKPNRFQKESPRQPHNDSFSVPSPLQGSPEPHCSSPSEPSSLQDLGKRVLSILEPDHSSLSPSAQPPPLDGPPTPHTPQRPVSAGLHSGPGLGTSRPHTARDLRCAAREVQSVEPHEGRRAQGAASGAEQDAASEGTGRLGSQPLITSPRRLPASVQLSNSGNSGNRLEAPWGLFSSPPRGGRRFKGVRQRKLGRYICEIRDAAGKRIWLGSYESEERAARIYDAAARVLQGKSAWLNFPTESPITLPPKMVDTLLAHRTSLEDRHRAGSLRALVQGGSVGPLARGSQGKACGAPQRHQGPGGSAPVSGGLSPGAGPGGGGLPSEGGRGEGAQGGLEEEGREWEEGEEGKEGRAEAWTDAKRLKGSSSTSPASSCSPSSATGAGLDPQGSRAQATGVSAGPQRSGGQAWAPRQDSEPGLDSGSREVSERGHTLGSGEESESGQATGPGDFTATAPGPGAGTSTALQNVVMAALQSLRGNPVIESIMTALTPSLPPGSPHHSTTSASSQCPPLPPTSHASVATPQPQLPPDASHSSSLRLLIQGLRAHPAGPSASAVGAGAQPAEAQATAMGGGARFRGAQAAALGGLQAHPGGPQATAVGRGVQVALPTGFSAGGTSPAGRIGNRPAERGRHSPPGAGAATGAGAGPCPANFPTQELPLKLNSTVIRSRVAPSAGAATPAQSGAQTALHSGAGVPPYAGAGTPPGADMIPEPPPATRHSKEPVRSGAQPKIEWKAFITALEDL